MRRTLSPTRLVTSALSGLLVVGALLGPTATAALQPAPHPRFDISRPSADGHPHAPGQAHDHAHHAHQHGPSEVLPLAGAIRSAAGASGVSPLLGNLGSHHFPITTTSPLAQRYFDEGLILTYGFNHAEAIRSFQDASRLDPACAMCHWGVALALGPNINAAMDPAAVAPAHAAIQRALALAPAASQRERDYIWTLAQRYLPDPAADRAALDGAYAHWMRELVKRYPADLDAATLFAEALMDLTPWNYWTPDGQPTTHTPEIVAVLESVLARNPNHPGANHYYIHAVEASRAPERAIPSAERLETLVPGAGHLVHMPAHAYWRVGRYGDAVRINERAILTDEASFLRPGSGADQGTHTFYALAYYPHNIHFVFAGAQMSGRSAVALAAARKLVAAIPEDAFTTFPSLEDFRPMPIYTLARFGRWAEVLSEPRPAERYQFTTGIWHWARGLAHVRGGALAEAEYELAHLDAIAQSEAMAKLTLASFAQASVILELAREVLAGELAAARGETDAAVARLEAAVRIQDGLAYIEPPAWFYPVRQNLGAVLLAAGRAPEAEAVYRADLVQYPANGWSLHGLAQSLTAQGKTDEAEATLAAFRDAWQQADVVLTASRF